MRHHPELSGLAQEEIRGLGHAWFILSGQFLHQFSPEAILFIG